MIAYDVLLCSLKVPQHSGRCESPGFMEGALDSVVLQASDRWRAVVKCLDTRLAPRAIIAPGGATKETRLGVSFRSSGQPLLTGNNRELETPGRDECEPAETATRSPGAILARKVTRCLIAARCLNRLDTA